MTLTSHAFENEEPYDTAARRPSAMRNRDFAPSSGESNQQEVRDVAARDEQHRADGDEQGHESRPQIASRVFVRRRAMTDVQVYRLLLRMLLRYNFAQSAASQLAPVAIVTPGFNRRRTRMKL